MIRYYAKVKGQLKELDQPDQSCWLNISPPFSQEELVDVAQQFEHSTRLF